MSRLLMRCAAKADAAGLGQCFESRAAIFTPSPKMSPSSRMMSAESDADPELDALVLRHITVEIGHRLLRLDRATHRIDDAAEFDQQPVACGLDDAAAGVRRSSGRPLLQKSSILDGLPDALTLRGCLKTSLKAHSDCRDGESGSCRLASGDAYQSGGGSLPSAACRSRLHITFGPTNCASICQYTSPAF